MTIEDDIAFFERVPLFAALDRQALQILAIGAETKQMQSGAVLFYAGELADGGYIVQSGALSVEPGASSGEGEYTIGPGALLGELSLLSDTVSPVTAIAKEPTIVIRIPRSLFRKMLEGYPAAAARLRDVMASRIGQLTQDLEAVQRKMDRGGGK